MSLENNIGLIVPFSMQTAEPVNAQELCRTLASLLTDARAYVSKFRYVDADPIPANNGWYDCTAIDAVTFAGTWVKRSLASGTAGLPGPQGPIGLPGESGLAGIAGTAGGPGPAGLPGANGLNGEIGPQGAAGLQGLGGADGLAGPIGPTGPAGPVALAGTSGLNGADGLPGAAGPAGPQGLQGIPGEVALGNAGPTGPIGPAGPIGITGLRGAGWKIYSLLTAGQTPPVADGVNGSLAYLSQTMEVFVKENGVWVRDGSLGGPAGPQGPIGPVGTAGPRGLNGNNGPAGPTGLAGATGVAGADGPQGLVGPIGVTGSTQLNGPANPIPGQGRVSDYYLNNTTGDYFEKINGTTWLQIGNLKGPIGAAGTGGTSSTGGSPLTGSRFTVTYANPTTALAIPSGLVDLLLYNPQGQLQRPGIDYTFSGTGLTIAAAALAIAGDVFYGVGLTLPAAGTSTSTGVSTFNTRSGAVALTEADVLTVVSRANQLAGGLQSVISKAAMIAILAAKRDYGMTVAVYADPILANNGRYDLATDLITWVKQGVEATGQFAAYTATALYNAASAYVTYPDPVSAALRIFHSIVDGAAAVRPAPVSAANVLSTAWEEISPSAVTGATAYVQNGLTPASTTKAPSVDAVTSALASAAQADRLSQVQIINFSNEVTSYQSLTLALDDPNGRTARLFGRYVRLTKTPVTTFNFFDGQLTNLALEGFNLPLPDFTTDVFFVSGSSSAGRLLGSTVARSLSRCSLRDVIIRPAAAGNIVYLDDCDVYVTSSTTAYYTEGAGTVVLRGATRLIGGNVQQLIALADPLTTIIDERPAVATFAVLAYVAAGIALDFNGATVQTLAAAGNVILTTVATSRVALKSKQITITNTLTTPITVSGEAWTYFGPAPITNLPAGKKIKLVISCLGTAIVDVEAANSLNV